MVYAWPKPKMQKFEVRRPEPNQFCQWKWLEPGKGLQYCLEETKGATYCKACLEADARRPSGSRFVGVKSVGKWGHMS